MQKKRVSVSDQEILQFVKNHPKCSYIEIATHFKASHSSIFAKTKKLCEDGLLVSCRVLSDRSVRSRTVFRLSDAGVLKTTHVAERKEIIPAKPEEPVSKSPKPNSNSINVVVDDIARVLVDAIISRAKELLAVELTKIMPDVKQPSLSNLPTIDELFARFKDRVEEKSTKTKITIVGLMPNQAGVISRDLGDVFDLQFWNDDDGFDKLKAMCKGSKKVLLHTKHTSHSIQDTIKSTGAELVLVGGGVTQMIDCLTSIFVDQVEKAA